MLHKAIKLSQEAAQSGGATQSQRDTIEAYAKAHEFFYAVRLAFLNMGIWFFCFRYWNISQVMPVHLSGNQVSKGRKWTTLAIFLVGSFANFFLPCLQCYYDFKIDGYLSEP